ncbi:MAG: MM0924 family protein [Pyrinomonadaceae bacterium]
MQELLSKLIGKKVDLYCGSASSLRGEIIKVEGGVMHLKDSEEKMCFVAIDKIVAVWEADDEGHRAGFVSKI